MHYLCEIAKYLNQKEFGVIKTIILLAGIQFLSPVFAQDTEVLEYRTQRGVAQASETEWKTKFLSEFKALQNLIVSSHPAMHDPDFPHFKEWAKMNESFWDSWQIDSKVAYNWATRYYVGGLGEPHTWVTNGEKTRFVSWPGFYMVSDGEKFLVDTTHMEPTDTSDNSIPPHQSVLIDCEGKMATELIDENVISFHRSRGKSLIATKLKLAPYLFFQTDNPFVKWPTTCSFLTPNSETITLDLKWRGVDEVAYQNFIKSFGSKNFGTNFDYKRYDNGANWISMHNFSFPHEGASEVAREIRSNIDNGVISSKDFFVFDMRGNSGGSFDRGILEAILGEGSFDSLNAGTWERWSILASTYSLYLHNERLAKANSVGDESLANYYSSIVGRIQDTISSGGLYYDEKINSTAAGIANEFIVNNQKNPAFYVIIDRHCFSACLVFLDALKNYPNVTFVGEPTDYDQPYMPIGSPMGVGSGRNKLTMPFAIIFGRNRGYNESLTPDITINPLVLNSMTDQDLLSEIEKLIQSGQ